MKKFSILMLFIFTAFLFLTSAAISQDAGTGTGTEAEKITTDNATTEDVTTENAEKVFEKEEVQILKGKPRSFSDGYNTYVNDKVRFELFEIDNIMPDTKFYKIDNGADQKYTEPFTLSDEGAHVLYYYSIDKMGNKEMQKSINVIVDKTAPEVIVVVKAPFAKTGETIYASDKFSYEYTISAKDNISGVAGISYAVKGEEHKEYVKPFAINSVEPVKIDIAAEDKVGNLTKKYLTKVIDENGNLLSESMDDVKITVDKTSPTVEIKADKEFFKKENTLVASKEYKYTITGADTESGIKAIYYRVDNKSEFILYTGELMFNSNGMHKIEAIAKDGVGNISKTAVLDIFVDIIPADTNIKLIAE